MVLSITSRRSGVGSRRREERGVSVGLDDAFRVDTTQERIHPGPVERGRTPVIRGAGGEWPQRLPSKTKSTTRPQWLFSRRLSMKLSIFLPRANAVPEQEVLTAGWQPGTFCSTSWGRMATAKRLGAGVRNVKEGRRSDRVGRIGCQVPARCIPFLVWSHTVTQPRRERDGHNPDRPATGHPGTNFLPRCCRFCLRHRGSPPRRGKKVGFDAGATASPVERACHCPCCLPQTCPQVPPDLGNRGKGKVLSLARLPRCSEVAVAMIGPSWSRLTLFCAIVLFPQSCPVGSQEDKRPPPRLVGSRHPRLPRATQTRFSPLQFLSLQTSSKPQLSAIRPSAPSFSSSKCSPPAD